MMLAHKKKTTTKPAEETEWYLYRPSSMTHMLVFFGGFFDGTFKPVLNAVSHYKANHWFGKTTGLLYFSWSHAAWWSDFAEKKIKEVIPGSNLSGLGIIGHSYGAHSAHKVAGRVNLAIDALVTVDGVSWGSKLLSLPKPKSVRTWINTYEKWIGDFSDLVAFFGGHWGSEAGADSNIVVPKVTHAEFHKMLVPAIAGMKSAMNLK